MKDTTTEQHPLSHPEFTNPDARAIYLALLECESALQALNRSLQLEREHVAVFQFDSLLEAVSEKEQVQARLAQLRVSRRDVVAKAWVNHGLSFNALPDDLNEAMRSLTQADQSFAPLVEVSGRLAVLVDVARELQNVNRVLVQRALSWIDSYRAEVLGTTGASAYDAAGRRTERQSRMTYRTI